MEIAVSDTGQDSDNNFCVIICNAGSLIEEGVTRHASLFQILLLNRTHRVCQNWHLIKAVGFSMNGFFAAPETEYIFNILFLSSGFTRVAVEKTSLRVCDCF